MLKGGVTIIYVSDMDRAVTFYADTLGLKVTYRAGDDYCGLDAGDGCKVGLHPAGEHSPTPGKNGATIIGFGVTQPIDDVVAALQKKGVPFTGPIIDDAEGGVRLAFFNDPDGNNLYLCESKNS